MTPLDLAGATDAAAIEAVTHALYGGSLAEDEGVLHVVAVVRRGESLRVLRIEERTPKSPTDFFALNLARARADSIIATGAILRAESDLAHDLRGAGAIGLGEWRRTRLKRDRAPTVAILTRGANLPAEHPAYRGEGAAVVYTRADRASALREELPSSVEVIGLAVPSLTAAISHCRRDRGARTVSVEAGPSVAGHLYRGHGSPDELLLSEFLGDIPDELVGGELATLEQVDARLTRVADPVEVTEASGRWRFSRWLRREDRS